MGKSNGLVIDSIDGTVEFINQLHADRTQIPVVHDSILQQNYTSVPDHHSVDVLITGSLHLVGNFLSILDPDVTSK